MLRRPHLWVRNGNDAGVLLVSVPRVLDLVDLRVIELSVGHVLPSR